MLLTEWSKAIYRSEVPRVIANSSQSKETKRKENESKIYLIYRQFRYGGQVDFQKTWYLRS